MRRVILVIKYSNKNFQTSQKIVSTCSCLKMSNKAYTGKFFRKLLYSDCRQICRTLLEPGIWSVFKWIDKGWDMLKNIKNQWKFDFFILLTLLILWNFGWYSNDIIWIHRVNTIRHFWRSFFFLCHQTKIKVLGMTINCLRQQGLLRGIGGLGKYGTTS